MTNACSSHLCRWPILINKKLCSIMNSCCQRDNKSDVYEFCLECHHHIENFEKFLFRMQKTMFNVKNFA